MLKKLFISNYAIIDKIEIDIDAGFTTITGETGAGKSIILGALNLLLGNRFDTNNFNNPLLKCIVEGFFDVSKLDVSSFFLNYDIDFNNELIIRREFSSSGNSRTFINDTPTKLDVLKKLSYNLIDIHSQHENLLIYNEYFQIDLIDRFAQKNNPHFSDLFMNYKTKFNLLNDMQVELKMKYSKLSHNQTLLKEKQDIISIINKLELVDVNKDDIENELLKIKNIHLIKDRLDKVFRMINFNEVGLLPSLKNIIYTLSELTDFDATLKQVVSRLNENLVDINDIIMDCHALNNDLYFDSNKLEYLNDKINGINNLEQKLNVEGVDMILEKYKSLNDEVNLLDSTKGQIEKLELEIEGLKQELYQYAKEISNHRKTSTIKLENDLKNDLSDLGMIDTEIKFNFTTHEKLMFNGLDNVSLLFSANKGHSLNPLSSIASGGEIARLMLCIKKHLFSINNFTTVIFDEIDSGVSGEIGSKMGKILKSMSRYNQIICITHLPQIASLGSSHYKVFKYIKNDITSTSINKLTYDDRITEIARMLSGEVINKEAIANAKKMLDI